MWHQRLNRNFMKLRELFVHRENHNNIIYSAILLSELPSSAILESTPEYNQHCLWAEYNQRKTVTRVCGKSPQFTETCVCVCVCVCFSRCAVFRPGSDPSIQRRRSLMTSARGRDRRVCLKTTLRCGSFCRRRRTDSAEDWSSSPPRWDCTTLSD